MPSYNPFNNSTTATEQAAALIQRYHQNQALNAFIFFDAEDVYRQAARLDALDSDAKAQLPLFGQAIIVKDNIETAAIPTTAGCRYFAGNIPVCNAPVVQRLLDAGALLAGKANMHELAFGITSNNAAYGSVHNPHKPGYIAGGSSGGTAAAIAAGIVPAGLGTDTGGSMRIPAALCGVVGLRPTIGRYPAQGLIRLSATRDTAGPMARTVAEVRLLDQLLCADKTMLAPPALPELSRLRLGVPPAYFTDRLAPEVAAPFNTLLASLRDAGAELIRADIPAIAELNEAVSFPIALYEARQHYHAYARQHAGGDFADLVAAVSSPDVKAILAGTEQDGGVSAAAYREALEVQRPRLQQTYRAYFAAHDIAAILFPTTALPACPIGQDETIDFLGQPCPVFPTYIKHTDPASNAGIPAISLPLASSAEGLPLGVELNGAVHQDAALLAVAQRLEAHINERH